MTDLFIYDEKIDSVFHLLGKNENDISYSVGYAFSNCPLFLKAFMEEIGIIADFEPAKIKIKLQRHESHKGFTDFEIIQEGVFHVIVEAKRGWHFPSLTQLEKYANRLSFAASRAWQQKLVVFNESTPAYTAAHFTEIGKLEELPQVISWQRLQKLAGSAIKGRSIIENHILKQLISYLEDISTMQKIDSNQVYVVSLGGGKVDHWNITWQDIVNEKNKYFHPVGGGKGGWPKEPPNYIAFRYNGQLQSIHHIDDYEVFTQPHLHFTEIPNEIWDPHYLYNLGPAIRPAHEVRTGKQIPRSMRVWAALDLLLTSSTVGEARDLTQRRQNV